MTSLTADVMVTGLPAQVASAVNYMVTGPATLGSVLDTTCGLILNDGGNQSWILETDNFDESNTTQCAFQFAGRDVWSSTIVYTEYMSRDMYIEPMFLNLTQEVTFSYQLPLRTSIFFDLVFEPTLVYECRPPLPEDVYVNAESGLISGSFAAMANQSIYECSLVDEYSQFSVQVQQLQVHVNPRADNVTMYVPVSSSALTIALGAGLGGGVGFLVLVLAVLLVLLVSARRRAQQKPFDFEDMIEALQNIVPANQRRFPREIKRDNIKLLDVLGKGNFGEVRKGLLSEIPGTPGYIVAVKALHLDMGVDRGAILQEAALMAQFNSAFVVGLVGVVTVGEPLMVILEYCEHGALDKYLQKHDIGVKERLQLAGDCAEGLAYLTLHNFIHRDVAARNILLSSERRCKIADFGMSREVIDSNYYHSTGGQLPVRWTAPEALEERRFSQQSDCWSFGVLLYEIWTKADLPYKGMPNQKVWVEVLAGYRLPCPPECPAAVYTVMESCWREYGQRPGFDWIVIELRQLEMEASMMHSQGPALGVQPSIISMPGYAVFKSSVRSSATQPSSTYEYDVHRPEDHPYLMPVPYVSSSDAPYVMPVANNSTVFGFSTDGAGEEKPQSSTDDFDAGASTQNPYMLGPVGRRLNDDPELLLNASSTDAYDVAVPELEEEPFAFSAEA